mgnify:CR=1 FL=1
MRSLDNIFELKKGKKLKDSWYDPGCIHHKFGFQCKLHCVITLHPSKSPRDFEELLPVLKGAIDWSFTIADLTPQRAAIVANQINKITHLSYVDKMFDQLYSVYLLRVTKVNRQMCKFYKKI